MNKPPTKIEFLWIAAGQLINTIGILIFLKIAASTVNSEEYGQFTIALTVATIINQIYTGGIISAFFRYYSIAQSTQRIKDFTTTLIKISKSIIVNVLIGALVVSVAICSLGEVKIIPLILVMCLYALIQFINGMMTSIYNAARERRTSAISQIIEPLARIIIIFAVAKWGEVNSLTMGATYVLSSAITGAYQLRKLKKLLIFEKIRKEKNKSEIENEIKEFSRSFILWGFFSSLYQISDRYSLKYYSGDSSVGEYGFMYQLGYGPMILATNVLVNYISPMIYTKMGHNGSENIQDGAKEHAHKISILLFAITGVAVFFTQIFHKEILVLFGSSEFTSNSHLFPILILSAGIFSASQVIAVNILGKLQPEKIRDIKIYSGIIGVTINVLGARYFGIDGVVYSGLLYSIIHYIGIFYKSK